MLPPRGRNGALGDQKGPRMEDEVGFAPSVKSLWAISSTSLQVSVFGVNLKNGLGEYIRFKTKDIRNSLSFISYFGADLTNGVDEVDAHHPFVHRELNFSSEVVEMSNEGGENFTTASIGLWSDCVDAVLGEVWVES
jgi:hypothetical protein